MGRDAAAHEGADPARAADPHRGHRIATRSDRAALTAAPRFKAKLEPVPHGGLFVIVPAGVAERVGLAYGARVRGTVNGEPYRSSLMMYSGVFHMGVHLAVARAAGVRAGERVEVTIALDRQEDAARNWERLSPATRRGYVKNVIEAKRAQTRAGRIARIVDTLAEGVPPRRTWEPKR